MPSPSDSVFPTLSPRTGFLESAYVRIESIKKGKHRWYGNSEMLNIFVLFPSAGEHAQMSSRVELATVFS